MSRRIGYWYKLVGILIALLLVAPLLTACGDDDNDDETTQPATSQTPVTEPTTAQPSVSTKPIKIGLLSDWTGPTGTTGSFGDKAIAVFVDQMKAQGGLLGREVKVVTADGEGTVSGGAAAATKLITQENVSVIVGGGGSHAELIAVGTVCNDSKVPFVNWAAEPADLSQLPYIISACNPSDALIFEKGGEFAVQKLGAKKVAILGENSDTGRAHVDAVKPILEAANVELVETEYVNVGTTDFSPYVTKIKAAEPDTILMFSVSPSAYMAVLMQMQQLGLKDIKFVSLCVTSTFAVGIPQAVGTYHTLIWLPSSTDPANVKWMTDFKAKYKQDPVIASTMAYHVLWTAAHAILLAGSDDRDAIQKAMRSGNLTFDSVLRPDYRIGTDGQENVVPIVALFGTDHTFTQVYP